MSLTMSLTVPLLFLIFNSGFASNRWSMSYNPNPVCALKGSTVTLGCSFQSLYTVEKTFWSKDLDKHHDETPDLLDDPEYRDRVQYLGDKQHNCSLSLRDVRENDQSNYYFRFITDRHNETNQGMSRVQLLVTGLQVEVPERVMEGDKVTLTCKATCSLTDSPSFNWYRNGAPLSSRTEQLYLQSVSREDAGRYSCSVLDLNLHSPEVTLSVLYPPKSVSVSISPSGEIVEGSSVTLTCSSDGNPPVQKYTWFKKVDKDVLQKWTGQIYSITNIRSTDSGKYQCTATNTQGSQSSEYKSLTVLHAPEKVQVSISETDLDGSLTLTCISDGNPPVQNYTWFKEGGSSPVGSGNRYSAVESGSYYCVAQNKYGSQTAAAVMVTLKDYSMGLYVGVGVGLSGVAAIIAVVLLMCFFSESRKKKNKKQKRSRKLKEHNYQNADSNAKDDAYTALNPVTRSSNDVYSTLATVNTGLSDDAYIVLDP